jgi:DNA-binding protein HU-beta
MNRSEFVAAVAGRTGMSQSDVDKVLTAMFDEISEVVAGDSKLTIAGYLSVERSFRNARTGRNPQTGEPVDIPATYTAKVSAGSKLKAAAKG